jgi:hypothetical protein
MRRLVNVAVDDQSDSSEEVDDDGRDEASDASCKNSCTRSRILFQVPFTFKLKLVGWS